MNQIAVSIAVVCNSKELLKKGANPDCVTEDGKSPLQICALFGLAGIAQVLRIESWVRAEHISIDVAEVWGKCGSR